MVLLHPYNDDDVDDAADAADDDNGKSTGKL